VTPVDNTNKNLLKPIGQGTDSNVDVADPLALYIQNKLLLFILSEELLLSIQWFRVCIVIQFSYRLCFSFVTDHTYKRLDLVILLNSICNYLDILFTAYSELLLPF